MAQLDVERYEVLARQWLDEARKATEENDRNSCLAIAEGYARLVTILGGSPQTSKTSELSRSD